MTCQHCETRILDEEYRCRRCGRRVRNTPERVVGPPVYPVTQGSSARALQYHFQPNAEAMPEPVAGGAEQQPLFNGSIADARVIPFDSLTTRAERQSIHARAAGMERPEPLKAQKIQLRHARPAKPARNDQRNLEFQGQDDDLPSAQPSIICDAPVAPARMRLKATAIDGLVMALPCALTLGLYIYAGGTVPEDKHLIIFMLAALATIPVFYKLLWTFAGSDTIGMRQAGLQLVDFDGNPPSQARRFLRCFGSWLSLLAAGIGLVWSLADEDRLTWHDYISSTFPTFAFEEE